MTVKNTNTSTEAGLLFSYYICLSFWAAQNLGMSLLSRNVAGQTKKSVAVAMNFIAWAAGNAAGESVCSALTTRSNNTAIGPQVFRSNDAPRYFIAFATHLGCYSLLIVVLVVLRFTLKSRNSVKDKAAADGVQEARDEKMTHAFEDLTDKENANFRYMY